MSTQISDVIVPEIFTPYVQQISQEKSAIIQSGAISMDPAISSQLDGGGISFNSPSFRDLANEDENVSSDDDPGVNDSTPSGTSTSLEIAVRLSRNKSWSSADLAKALAGEDPMESIASRAGNYWALRLQAAFVATTNGVYADNAAAPTGVDTHLQNDMTVNLAFEADGTTPIAYNEATTTFGPHPFLDTVLTMGDSMQDLTLILVHSVVYNRMQKLNLIVYRENSMGLVNIPTYLGRDVIVDDGMPNAGGVYESRVFGESACRMGMSSPKVPTAVEREEKAGNGGGVEILYNRVEWCLHPEGHRFQATPVGGGPSNAATTGNLAHADSWARVFPERKQIRMARLLTRETA